MEYGGRRKLEGAGDEEGWVGACDHRDPVVAGAEGLHFINKINISLGTLKK